MEYPSYIVEYVIKCEDCGDLVDCRVEEFLDHLRNGLNIKEALDAMYIFRECTRTRFIVPSKINKEMENRNLIEGRISYNPALKPSKDAIEEEAASLGKMVKNSRSRIDEDDKLDIQDLQELQNEEAYLYPTELGVSVINRSDYPDSKYMKFAGAGKYSQILSGRKFICL